MNTEKENFAITTTAQQLQDALHKRLIELAKRGVYISFEYYDAYNDTITISARKASLTTSITIKTTQNIFDALLTLEVRV